MSIDYWLARHSRLYCRACDRIRGARGAYGLARLWNVGRAQALWRAARFLVTGSTGRYRIHI